MEDTLGAYRRTCYDTAQNRLNPCSNGRYSRRTHAEVEQQFANRLNPCSNGRYSRSVASGQEYRNPWSS